MTDEQRIQLTDLIDVSVLQRVQDSFFRMTGINAVTADYDGTPVTRPSTLNDFCFKYTRKSDLGCMMCRECDRFGAEEAYRTGNSISYFCHAGLVDFAAPIVANNKLVGCFIGGQVLTAPPVESAVREYAVSIDVDPDEYWEAVQKIPVVSRESIDKASTYLTELAGVLSDMAYSRYITDKANEQLERASKLQSDFVANMSHEIRTPMNAVVGFSELALREDISPAARDYIEQIKTSSNALLSIINDILDFSKIQSNKLDIIPVPYEPLSVIDDVANITMTRLTEKDVELIVDVDPTIPTMLEGDNLRMRQILINLCNNATKFTDHGKVAITVNYTWVSSDEIDLKFVVSDTGIGIKQENFEKIFHSFEQVDSKRNRNIEGTGLGLAICKLLVELMGGHIEVHSTYGKGSEFSFSLRQKVLNTRPSVVINGSTEIYLGGAFGNEYLSQNFVDAARKLGISTEIFLSRDQSSKIEDIHNWMSHVNGKEAFYFIEQEVFDPELLKYNDGSVNICLLAETFADMREWADNKEILILRKPLSIMNLGSIFNHKGIRYRTDQDASDIYSFTAPDARLLVVDDNVVNLTVAKGLLEPIKSYVDVASSAREALQMLRVKKYDLIFMDHMMPEMDGVEATHIIRKDYPDYSDTPIIALTANAMSGVKDMFIEEGMNDFVPKPIELRVLLDKVKSYLPADKVCRDDTLENILFAAEEAKDEPELMIGDLDTASALRLLGSKELYMQVLRIYSDSIEEKAARIYTEFSEGNWNDYTVDVHALKSSSRQIGAMELGELAYRLEMAGKNLDIYMINAYTPSLLKKFRSYKSVLDDFLGSDKEESSYKIPAEKETLRPLFDKMRGALDELDMDTCEKIMEELSHFEYPEIWQGKYKALKSAVEEMDAQECADVLDSWI